jgi:hypothetical protein
MCTRCADLITNSKDGKKGTLESDASVKILGKRSPQFARHGAQPNPITVVVAKCRTVILVV